MRWVKDGPDIPVEIVQAVEDGQVVFFCGAGVSQQAGLPSFRGLVDAVYEKLHRVRKLFPVEQKAFEKAEYDQVFASLEAAIKEPGLVRGYVAEALELAADADTSTHQALLKLATDRSGRCRLVTTNYDRCFSRHPDTTIRVDAAPRLPVPTPGRWSSVVHIHGALDHCDADKRDLVLSSADFGAAYLVDGWATRFLRELFQHFIVLFVGYSADDLVVKYMLQALAVGLAERGEKPRAFALAQVEESGQSTQLTWESKGIKPIMYPNGGSHRVLHETLRTWAENASLGLLGRRSVVAERLGQPPPADHGEVVDQVVWALKDESGATARYVAERESSPEPGHWLRVLDDNKLFSLDNVPLVGPVGIVPSFQSIHPVTWNLARWLARHLAEASVLDWALSKGGSVHPNFRWLIRSTLDGQKAALRPEIARAWTFLARHRPDAGTGGFGDLLSLAKRIESGAWDLELKSEVEAIIEPSFVVSRDRLKDIVRRAGNAESDSYPLKLDIRFAGGDETEYVLDSIRGRPNCDSLLTALLDDCTTYLRRAMEAEEYLDLVSADQDWTYISVRSIATTVDGHYLGALVALIDLTAACIDSASRVDPLLARCQVEYWKTVNYPIFRRLVCFALARPGLFAPAEALGYILRYDSVIWHHTCGSELRQLLAYIWPLLSLEQSLSLTQRILACPPAQLYRSDLSAADLAAVSADAICERLSVLEATGRPLPPDAAAFLSEVRRVQPSERIRSTAREESLVDLTTPEIADILRGGFPEFELYRKQWMGMVANDWPRAVAVLRQLSDLNSWPIEVWAAALSHAVASTNSEPKSEGILPLLDVLLAAPDGFVAQSLHSLTLLLHILPRLGIPSGDDLYWRLWDRTFDSARCESAVDSATVESLEGAINTAVGSLTEALFQWAGRRPGVDTAGDFWKRLSTACNERGNWGKAARGVAAMNLAWLFEKKSEWTSATLLPFFDWSNPGEARIVWQGFSFGAGFSPALWTALSKDFLATFENLDRLDTETARRLYQLLGRIAVHEPNWLTNDQTQRIVTSADHLGREQIALVFWQNLDAAGDKAGSLWRDRIGPWFEACWQPDDALKDKAGSHNLIRAVLSAGDAFPDAVDLITSRLPALDRAESAIFAVARSEVPEQFPQATLKLLDRVVNRNQRFYKGDLENLLARIAQAWPEARQDSRFLNLSNFAAG
ncbi:MAG: SIR2 family protein [Bryobacteraceae bacterium]